jgi:hypothetical protein
MATYKHLRSSTANKRPTTSIADGQLAINSNAASAGLFFKDSTGATIIKIGPVHVGTTAPNATPGAGGSSGNSTGEVWLDTSLTPVGVKIWNGSAWVNGTPIGSTTVQGLLELATDAETQAGSDTARAVTPASLQSKVSDSTSTTSSTTIASSTAVKSAFDLANAALPKSGGTVTGNLEIGTAGSLTFEGSVADGFETTIAVTNPTADRTITLPDQTGNMLVSGNASIVNADVNASAAIAGTKIAPDFGSQTVQTTGIFSHALGSAAAPTITFTGDTNTGIYSPGADQVAISTNGTGRAIIDSTGRLLIGVSSDLSVRGIGHSIQVVGSTFNGSAPLLLRFANNANPSGLEFAKSRGAAATDTTVVSSGDSIGQITFSAADGTQFVQAAHITAAADSTPGTGSMPGRLVFSTTPSGSGTPTERMRLDSSGRLGLGTSSPGSVFHARLPNTSTATIATFDRSDGAVSSEIHYDGSDGRITFGTTTNHPLSFETNNTRAVTIDTSQRVGIGTTSPSQTLDVAGDITFGSSNKFISSANVLSGPTGQAGAYIRSAVSSASVPSYAGADDTNTGIFIPGSDVLGFTAGGTERARIDSSGRLLVGTSSASAADATVIVQGNGQSSAFGSRLYLSRGEATPADNAGLGHLNFSDSTHTISAMIRALRDGGTWSASSKPGRIEFSTTKDGSSSPTLRTQINNQGTHYVVSESTGFIAITTLAAGTGNYLYLGYSDGVAGAPTSGLYRYGVFTNGNVVNSNNSYGAISDIKLKENIVDANSQWDDLKALQVRNYNFKEGETHTQIGLVAQEVELVSPGLVSESPDRDAEGNDLGTVTKSVNYSVLYMKAVKALQEAMERIETLEAKVAALESA